MYPIPANATRIRYLESTGTQYIDTGVLGGPNIRIDVRVRYDYRGASIVRAYDVVDGNAYTIFVATGNNNTNIQGAYNKNGEFNNLEVDVPFGSWVDASLSNRSLTVNGTTVSTSASTIPGMSSTLYVFALNRSGTITPTGGVIAYLKIWQNGALVRDYIPVRVGSVGYLFDRVSGQLFGNAGTGAFVLGPDTFAQGVVPTRMMAMGVRKKPYDAEVEYLINNAASGQYVQVLTGVYNSLDLQLEMEIEKVSSSGEIPICGNAWAGTSTFMQYTSSQIKWHMVTSGSINITVNPITQKCNVVASNGFLSVNGSSASGVALSNISNQEIKLFAVAGTYNAQNKMKLYWVKIKVGQETVRDFIPVRVGTTGYLYDRVSGQLFGNAGTGSFTIGPDKS